MMKEIKLASVRRDLLKIEIEIELIGTDTWRTFSLTIHECQTQLNYFQKIHI